MTAGQQLRRVHRLAGRAPLRRPDDRAAPGRVRGRDRDHPPAHPPGGPRATSTCWPRPATRPPPGSSGGPARCWPTTPTSAGKLVEDRTLVPNAIEELLRFEPPSPVQARYVTQDVEHHGQAVPEGSAILLLNGSGNRDERKFPDADRFDVHRDDRPPPGLRLRDPLLPRRRPGPAGGSGRPRRGAPALPHVGGRLGQRRAGPDLDRPGLGDASRCHHLTGGPLSSERGRPHP